MFPIVGVGMVDAEAVKDRVFENESSEEKSIAERVSERISQLNKRTYISDPSEAPEWANVQEGQRGGYYYDPQESLGLDESEMYTLAEESVTDLNPDDYPSEEYMVDDVEDGMMDMIEDEFDVDFMELDDGTYDQLTSALRGYAEETVDEAYMIENMDKSRIYVDSPEDVPDQYEAQTSERGAVFYETDESSGGSEPSDVSLEPGDEILSPEYGDVIREEIEEGNVDLEDLTEATGLPEETIGDMVTGEYRPNSETREQLNEVLDGSVSEEYVREKSDVGKSRVYVDSPEDVPDQYEPQTSERGAVFYETDGGSGGGVTEDDVVETAGRMEEVASLAQDFNTPAQEEVEDAESLINEAFENIEEGDGLGRAFDLLNEAGDNLSIAIRDAEDGLVQDELEDVRDDVENITEAVEEEV